MWTTKIVKSSHSNFLLYKKFGKIFKSIDSTELNETYCKNISIRSKINLKLIDLPLDLYFHIPLFLTLS